MLVLDNLTSKSRELRKVYFIAHSCRTVRFLVALEPFFDYEGSLTSTKMLQIALKNDIEFRNIQAFRMYIQRLVRAGILMKTSYYNYSLNLNEIEREILHLMYELCEGDTS